MPILGAYSELSPLKFRSPSILIMLFRIAAESRVLKRVFYWNCMRYFSKRMLAEEKYLIDLDVRLKKNISDLKKINSAMIIHKAGMELNLTNSRENQPDVLQHTRENSSSHFYQIQRSFATGSNFTLVEDNEIKDCWDQDIPESKVLVDTLNDNSEISTKEPNIINQIFDILWIQIWNMNANFNSWQ